MAKKRPKRSTAMAIPAPTDERENISVRKIRNGYLIETSGVKRGKYRSETEYSPGRPVVTATVPKVSKPTPRPRTETKPSRPVALREVGFLKGQ